MKFPQIREYHFSSAINALCSDSEEGIIFSQMTCVLLIRAKIVSYVVKWNG